jgi:transposase
MGRKHINDIIKLNIIDLKERGYKRTEIADIHNINVKTVTRIIKKFKKEYTVERKSGTGKTKKYNIDKIVFELLTSDPSLTINQIVAILNNIHEINCSRITVYNRINFLEFSHKRPILKPLLTNKHLTDRETWATMYTNFNWENVIWSDETSVGIQPNCYSKIWILKDMPVIKRTIKHPLKVSIWGCMLKGNKLIIHIYDETLNGNKYIDILQLKLLPFYLDYLNKHKIKLIFQQDNAPIHTYYKTLDFLKSKNIEVMFWPANSPDLNPIENIWNLLKNKIGKIYVTNKSELIEAINKTVNEFEISIIDNLVDSMNNRIKELFNNNFDSINY